MDDLKLQLNQKVKRFARLDNDTFEIELEDNPPITVHDYKKIVRLFHKHDDEYVEDIRIKEKATISRKYLLPAKVGISSVQGYSDKKSPICTMIFDLLDSPPREKHPDFGNWIEAIRLMLADWDSLHDVTGCHIEYTKGTFAEMTLEYILYRSRPASQLDMTLTQEQFLEINGITYKAFKKFVKPGPFHWVYLKSDLYPVLNDYEPMLLPWLVEAKFELLDEIWVPEYAYQGIKRGLWKMALLNSIEKIQQEHN
jgi:hypothetical protein